MLRREPRERPLLGADAGEPRRHPSASRIRSSRRRRCASTGGGSGSTRATCTHAPAVHMADADRDGAGAAGCDAGGPRAEDAGPAHRSGRPMTRRRSTRSSSGPGPTGSPPRSTWPVPGGLSASTRRPSPSAAGRGPRSSTLPGFVHDVCASVHPLSLASPFFRSWTSRGTASSGSIPTRRSPMRSTPGRSVVLERRPRRPRPAALGRDADAWRRLFGPLVARAGAARRPSSSRPVAAVRRATRSSLARFGLPALLPATASPGSPSARTGGAGAVRRDGRPLDAPPRPAAERRRSGWCSGCSPTPSAGRWPAAAAARSPRRSRPRRGRSAVEIVTGHRVDALADLPPARAYLLDVDPAPGPGDRRRPAARRGYRRQLEGFRYGPGVFKIDWALDGPIPWRRPADGARRDRPPRRDDRARSPRPRTPSAAAAIPSAPFVLLVQPTIADPSRAPEGKHVAWAYCHVPNGSTVDMTAAIEAQVERFAPGLPRLDPRPGDEGRRRRWRRTTRTTSAATSTAASATCASSCSGPVVRWNPYTTPDPAIFLCSSSTPPGGGVHGMSGRHAARAAERRLGRA